MSSPRVAVVGGGLAGIAAALRCAEQGCSVDLIEARPVLGGLTTSFRRGQLWVDNGQHVFLRCCTEYRRLLDRLGVATSVDIQDRLAIPVRTPAQRGEAWLRRGALPAPLHLAASLLRYRPLRWRDRLRAGRAVLALGRVDTADPANDAESFAGWLARHGQSRESVQALWELISLPTLNVRSADASLAQAAWVFQQGILADAAAADIGRPMVPLRELHGAAADRRLKAAGVRVHTGVKVRRIEASDHDRWRVMSDVDSLDEVEVILAAPPAVSERLLPPDSLPLRPGWSRRLSSSPIVNLHLVLDRPVLAHPFVAGVFTPVQWVFDRTTAAGLDQGQYLAVSLSAADDEIDRSTAELRARYLPELCRLLPGLTQAVVRDFFVTRERFATFRPSPDSARLRPEAVTRRPGLFLAGAWTATGWPATMEGAVRSGDTAANALLRRAVITPRERAAL